MNPRNEEYLDSCLHSSSICLTAAEAKLLLVIPSNLEESDMQMHGKAER